MFTPTLKIILGAPMVIAVPFEGFRYSLQYLHVLLTSSVSNVVPERGGGNRRFVEIFLESQKARTKILRGRGKQKISILTYF